MAALELPPTSAVPLRRLALASALFVLLAARGGRADPPAPAPAPAPAPPPGPERVKEKDDPYPLELRERVNQAVDRGVAYLFSKQRPDGSWPADGPELQHQRLGVTSLMTLACLMGGVSGEDPRIQQAFGYLRTLPLEKTYSVGVLLMALHARYGGSQEDSGGEVDAYGNPVHKDPCITRMNPTDREWMEKAVEFLLKHQRTGSWRYPQQGSDLSNTQYALLGLWAAARCGAKVPQDVWTSALEFLLQAQERTGPQVLLRITEASGDYRVVFTEAARARGFRYQGEALLTGSMTTAGMAGLVICQDELWASRRFTAEMRDKTRKGIRDAMAWLQDAFDVTRNPGQPQGGWHFYFLYGLERAGVLARTRFLGSKDWYLEGATYLLSKQRGDGSWMSEHVLLDSAFGVLFLKRAAMRSRRAAITPADEPPR